MPILAAQRSMHPDNLLLTWQQLGAERCWYALHTRPRQEKALSRQLLEREVPFYLPLVGKKLLVRGKCLLAYIPLFPGYVFLFGSDAERHFALTTRRVVQCVRAPDGAELARELRELQRLIDTGAPLTVEQRLVPGQRVEVRSGPLAGLVGTVLKRHGELRLLVTVHLLQQSVSLAIEDYLVRPLD